MLDQHLRTTTRKAVMSGTSSPNAAVAELLRFLRWPEASGQSINEDGLSGKVRFGPTQERLLPRMREKKP